MIRIKRYPASDLLPKTVSIHVFGESKVTPFHWNLPELALLKSKVDSMEVTGAARYGKGQEPEPEYMKRWWEFKNLANGLGAGLSSVVIDLAFSCLSGSIFVSDFRGRRLLHISLLLPSVGGDEAWIERDEAGIDEEVRDNIDKVTTHLSA